MKKIDLKRILLTDELGSYDFVFEFKLLSEIKESDKKELIDFLIQELINNKIAPKDFCIEYDSFDYINLEEINQSINKITYIEMTIGEHYLLEHFKGGNRTNVEYDKSQLFIISNNRELIFNSDEVIFLKDKYNEYSIYRYFNYDYYKNVIKHLLNVNNLDIEKIIQINNISIINILRGISKKSKRELFDKQAIADIVFNRNEDICVSIERRYESGDIDKIELRINLLELFKDNILDLVKSTIKYNLEFIKYNRTLVLYLETMEMNLKGLNDKIIFYVADQDQQHYKEINIKPLSINKILISQKEDEILELRNKIEALKEKE